MKKIIILILVALTLTACSGGMSSSVADHKTNPAHLAKLKEGLAAWTDWRSQNPRVNPDLETADLHDANLEKYDLHHALLSNANLSNADLKGADLNNANLRGANLSNADLTGTILTGVRYDSRTKWPQGFDPVAAGATLVGQ